MKTEKITLVTCKGLPDLDDDSAALPDALSERGLDPHIAVWDDPDVDWHEAGICVLRSVRDYASRRAEFLQWAKSVPYLLNHADVVDWNSDKHYLLEIQHRGLPIIPTTWIEPEMRLTKNQVHTRMPADGDFVVKPAVSSGGRHTGRYTATDSRSRGEAILHCMRELEKGRSVMIQRYLSDIDRQGESSLIYINGLAAYKVEKKAMLHPASTAVDEIREEVVTTAKATADEWHWGEQIRTAVHGYIRDRLGRDQLLLFNRVDIVKTDNNAENDFYVMEVSLIDGSLYISQDSKHLNAFADAIAMRVFW